MELSGELKVMWLEEHPLHIGKYQRMADEVAGLTLVNFTSWVDALTELRCNYNAWSAIILNPKCKLERGSLYNPKKFLAQALVDITELSAKNDRMIPWYILTELDATKFEDLIVNTREKYDEDWPQGYYAKSFDNNSDQAEILFKRIRNNARRNEYIQIHNGPFRPIFQAIDYLCNYGFDESTKLRMEDLLVLLVYNLNENNISLLTIRQVLENIAQYLIEIEALPSEFKRSSGLPIVKSCFRLLAGDEVILKIGYPHKKFILRGDYINNVMGKYLLEMLNVCNGAAHSGTETRYDSRNTKDYLSTCRTDFLINSYSLMLCDTILWLKQFTEIFKNPTKSIKIWDTILSSMN